MNDAISRRNLLKVVGAAGAAAAVPSAAVAAPQQGAQAPAPSPAQPAHGTAPPAPAPQQTETLFFFNDQEARFVEAAVERLIPADPEWPGAAWAGVLYFIDRQLAGAYGFGAKMYLKGPWVPDAPPQQGYQLRHMPAELYRIGIEETRQHCRQAYNGREFWDLGETVMDEVLKGLEGGQIQLPSLPAPVFFETLLANTVEGFLADPAYGGNRDMVSWRMIGFPGAYAQYVDLVELYDLPYTRPPISFANSAARHAHILGHNHEHNK
jgi:gluconate 2-dehydrogenase gamma chain